MQLSAGVCNPPRFRGPRGAEIPPGHAAPVADLRSGGSGRLQRRSGIAARMRSRMPEKWLDGRMAVCDRRRLHPEGSPSAAADGAVFRPVVVQVYVGKCQMAGPGLAQGAALRFISFLPNRPIFFPDTDPWVPMISGRCTLSPPANQWLWSSFRFYFLNDSSLVRMDSLP